jgi:hypothetical protein
MKRLSGEDTDLEYEAGAQGRRAVWVHVLLLPYWLFAWFLAGMLPVSGAAAGAEGLEAALWIGLAFAIWLSGVGFWVTLLRNLIRRRREGRYVSWLLPVFWAACNVFTIFFAIAYFAIAYLLPAVGRRLASQSRRGVNEADTR